MGASTRGRGWWKEERTSPAQLSAISAQRDAVTYRAGDSSTGSLASTTFAGKGD